MIMGSAAVVVLVALPFLFRAQSVTYSMERERQPPFDCVQGIQEYSCPGVEPLHPMQRNVSPSESGRSRARQDQNRRLAVRARDAQLFLFHQQACADGVAGVRERRYRSQRVLKFCARIS